MDSVVTAFQVAEECDVMIITAVGKIIRVHSNEIREAGRSTQVCVCCAWKTTTDRRRSEHSRGRKAPTADKGARKGR